MKYLLLTLTFIFSTSGLVNAEDHNSKWFMFLTETVYWSELDSPVSHLMQWGIDTYQNDSDCYEDLKRSALKANKHNILFEGKNRFKIEVLDWGYRAISNNEKVHSELHCTEVKLD